MRALHTVSFRRAPPFVVEPAVLCFACLRVCDAFLLAVCVALLLEPTELAKPVEMPQWAMSTEAWAGSVQNTL